MANWRIKKCSVEANKLMNFYGKGKPLAYSLYHKKVRNRDEIKKYIDYENFEFEDINNLKGVKEAFQIIEKFIKSKELIYIYGDYDADGVMSTSIMYKGLKQLGANVKYFIPDRVEDGYGLNINAIKDLIEQGTKLIITCDNGISAIEQIEFAIERNVKVIVLDHHEPVYIEEDFEKIEILPRANAVVDAKIKDCGYKFKVMCAGGLCFRFICGLYEYLGVKLENEEELCELATIATVCDVVDLCGENRALVKRGIKSINTNVKNKGLKTLMEVKDLKEVTSYSIGFVIGPCVNASGRLDSAKIAVQLFISEDNEEILRLAMALSEFNEERKDITARGLERIVEKIESSDLIKDKIIIVYDDETHESVAGIIAGRLREKYKRPAIVLTKSEDGAKGSGRSVEKYNMFEELNKVRSLMTKFGGHTMAVGLSIEKNMIDIFRKSVNNNCEMSIEELESDVKIDCVLELEDVTIKNIEELDILSPFGKGNEKPIFAIRNSIATNIRFVGKEKNIVSFKIYDGRKIVKAIDFDNYEKWIEFIESRNINIEEDIINFDAIINLDINEYLDNISPQIIIKEVKFLG